jgi:hypothetical protein
MLQRIAFVVFLAVFCQSYVMNPSAQGPAPAPAKPNPNNKIFQSPLFKLEIPKKNWDPILIGIGSSFVVFPEKSREAAVAIEAIKVRGLKDEEIVDQTATLEIDDWRKRRPLASGFKHEIITTPGGRVIVIDFTQPGSRGLERVRLYALLRGTDLYRVICTATPASFDKYQDVFRTMALTLTPTPAASQ